MNILQLLRSRFEPALAALVPNPRELLEMIRPSQDAKFGDYQANFAMKLGKDLGKPPRDVAQMVAAKVELADLCEPPEVAGPGFINLRLKDSWLLQQITAAEADDRLGVTPVSEPKTYVVDYSSPNVAKPMHVGHIRSTVIGDALYRTLKFLGHKVISDNHLGDWGTQFGMIIYGYKHFVDQAAYKRAPVVELGRLYKKVHKLVDYQETKAGLAQLEAASAEKQKLLKTFQDQTVPADKNEQKKHQKQLEKLAKQAKEAEDAWLAAQTKIVDVEHDSEYGPLIGQHAAIATDVLKETAKLHAGDAENVALWHEFLPACRDAIYTIYDRLDIRFDYELGESFYHEQLGSIVDDFVKRGLARESEGAMCVFLEGEAAPMIIRKKDGAFLYSTTDLATIQYRMQHWKPDVVLYVVDHRQGEHFNKLFAAAKLWGYNQVDLRHISFGTILGEDGKPYKTRSGDTVGLESLLDEACSRALDVVQANDREHQVEPGQQQCVAEIVGIGALKYADLMQNRTSDYKFSYDKMLATTGNTATYMQYSYARVQSIFRKAEIDVVRLRKTGAILIEDDKVRGVVLDLLRFSEALSDVLVDYQPNMLTSYLFELTQKFFVFYESHSVKNAETQLLRESRALVCDLVGRTIQTGLALLGIQTVDKM